MLVHSLPVKSRKELARDPLATLATHAGRVGAVLDRDLLGTKCQPLQSRFRDLQVVVIDDLAADV